MSVTSGFFNSLDGDRHYDAIQISSMFDGLFTDGVFRNFGNRFFVSSEENDMTVKVGTGRAWYKHTWTLNDDSETLSISSAESNDRIDAVVLEINNSRSVRCNRLKIKTGTSAPIPVEPNMESIGDYFLEVPIAYVYVRSGVNKIINSDITNVVGTSKSPYVKGILETDAILEEWEKTFTAWFSNIQNKLSGDVAGNLQRQISLLGEQLSVTKEIAITEYMDGYEPYSESQTPKLFHRNGVITMVGAVKVTKEISKAATGGDAIPMARIPEPYRPLQEINIRSQGSGNNAFGLRIMPDGYVSWARYGNTTNTVPIVNAWLNVDASWIIE